MHELIVLTGNPSGKNPWLFHCTFFLTQIIGLAPLYDLSILSPMVLLCPEYE